ncbi:unnamed protein product [Ambrosiozyma monospora]|uniref:Unnamed protein product n=1 Tax=Ambrosiozyma monospora TaxID=43982 RepID=A0ACB5SXF7_AMBMO|nr:unnamed protein product [Ambrosiozyma monospora]
MHNKLGHCGDYGESSQEFKKRCFLYFTQLLQMYYRNQSYSDDKHTTIIIVSHGAVISALLQLILGRPIFNEVPLCTPIYLKQSTRKRSVFNFMDYDFNLSRILAPPSDRELLRIINTPLDMTMLDFESIRDDYQVTIGDEGFTRIIQSPQRSRSSSLTSSSRRKRSNTLDLGRRKTLGSDEESERNALKQTRSFRSLQVMGSGNRKRTINLDKLHSYFSAGSSSEDDEDEDDGIYGLEGVGIPSIEERYATKPSVLTSGSSSTSLNKQSFDTFISKWKSDHNLSVHNKSNSSYSNLLKGSSYASLTAHGSLATADPSRSSSKSFLRSEFDLDRAPSSSSNINNPLANHFFDFDGSIDSDSSIASDEEDELSEEDDDFPLFGVTPAPGFHRSDFGLSDPIEFKFEAPQPFKKSSFSNVYGSLNNNSKNSTSGNKLSRSRVLSSTELFFNSIQKKDITIISTMTNSKSKTRKVSGSNITDCENEDDDGILSDHSQNGTVEVPGIVKSVTKPDVVSESATSDRFVPAFKISPGGEDTEESGWSRSSSPTRSESSSTPLDNFLNSSSSGGKANRGNDSSSLKGILFSKTSLLSSEDDSGSWFGGNFRSETAV